MLVIFIVSNLWFLNFHGLQMGERHDDVIRAFAEADPQRAGILPSERFAEVVAKLDSSVQGDEIKVPRQFNCLIVAHFNGL